MRCNQAENLLLAYAGRELGWPARWKVKRHLARCPSCRQEAQALAGVDARLRSWKSSAKPPFLLKQRIKGEVNVAPRLAQVSWGRRAAVAICALIPILALASGGIYVWKRTHAANDVAQMEEAVKHIKSAHIVVRVRVPGTGQAPAVGREVFYQGGLWRVHDTTEGDSVVRGNMLWGFNTQAKKLNMDACGLPIQLTLQGLLGSMGSLEGTASSVQASCEADTGPMTLQIAQGDHVQSRLAIVIDQANHLPISARREVWRNGAWQTDATALFEFNKPVADAVFDPKALVHQ